MTNTDSTHNQRENQAAIKIFRITIGDRDCGLYRGRDENEALSRCKNLPRYKVPHEPADVIVVSYVADERAHEPIATYVADEHHPAFLHMVKLGIETVYQFSRISGVPEGTLGQWLKGERDIGPEAALSVGKALRIDAEVVLYDWPGKGRQSRRERWASNLKLRRNRLTHFIQRKETKFMNDPKMVIDTLEKLLYATERARKKEKEENFLLTSAASYSAARLLLDDIEELLKENGLKARGGEAILRLRESFGNYLGFEPATPDSNTTYGAMGIMVLKGLVSELQEKWKRQEEQEESAL